MTHHKKEEGICSNCKFFSECRHAAEGIQFCEEYELAVPSQDSAEIKVVPGGAVSMKPNPQNNPDRSSKKFLGLCANCLHRDTCGFPKPESGVWHCEEYE